jgi:FkbM family methyltransferase
MMPMVAKIFKPILSRTVYRPGRIARIWFGPCKGLRYRIFPGFGLSHLYGGWEPHVLRAVVEHVKEGAVVYDLGANYGLHTLLFARAAQATGRVFAFEPMPRIRTSLIENISLNEFDTVTVVPLAVSNSVGNERFVVGIHDGAGHVKSGGRGNQAHAGSEQSIDVSVTTLDQFVRDGHPPPTFIKIDVEGSEGAVLQGASDVLREYRPTLLIELHTPEQDVLVGRELSTHGYSVVRVETGEQVRDLSVGWPDPNGIWGIVLATPTNR